MNSAGQSLLRPYCASGMEALIDLLEHSYRTTWAPHVSSDAWQRWSQQQQPRHYVQAMGQEFVLAETGSEVAGMIHWHHDFIHALHVHSRFRRRGVGTMLMRHAEQAIAEAGHRQARLETDSFNAASRTFYAAHGYVETGERPDEEWNSGLTTLLLVKELDARIERVEDDGRTP